MSSSSASPIPLPPSPKSPKRSPRLLASPIPQADNSSPQTQPLPFTNEQRARIARLQVRLSCLRTLFWQTRSRLRTIPTDFWCDLATFNIPELQADNQPNDIFDVFQIRHRVVNSQRITRVYFEVEDIVEPLSNGTLEDLFHGMATALTAGESSTLSHRHLKFETSSAAAESILDAARSRIEKFVQLTDRLVETHQGFAAMMNAAIPGVTEEHKCRARMHVLRCLADMGLAALGTGTANGRRGSRPTLQLETAPIPRELARLRLRPPAPNHRLRRAPCPY